MRSSVDIDQKAQFPLRQAKANYAAALINNMRDVHGALSVALAGHATEVFYQAIWRDYIEPDLKLVQSDCKSGVVGAELALDRLGVKFTEITRQLFLKNPKLNPGKSVLESLDVRKKVLFEDIVAYYRTVLHFLIRRDRYEEQVELPLTALMASMRDWLTKVDGLKDQCKAVEKMSTELTEDEEKDLRSQCQGDLLPFVREQTKSLQEEVCCLRQQLAEFEISSKNLQALKDDIGKYQQAYAEWRDKIQCGDAADFEQGYVDLFNRYASIESSIKKIANADKWRNEQLDRLNQLRRRLAQPDLFPAWAAIDQRRRDQIVRQITTARQQQVAEYRDQIVLLQREKARLNQSFEAIDFDMPKLVAAECEEVQALSSEINSCGQKLSAQCMAQTRFNNAWKIRPVELLAAVKESSNQFKDAVIQSQQTEVTLRTEEKNTRIDQVKAALNRALYRGDLQMTADLSKLALVDKSLAVQRDAFVDAEYDRCMSMEIASLKREFAELERQFVEVKMPNLQGIPNISDISNPDALVREFKQLYPEQIKSGNNATSSDQDDDKQGFFSRHHEVIAGGAALGATAGFFAGLVGTPLLSLAGAAVGGAIGFAVTCFGCLIADVIDYIADSQKQPEKLTEVVVEQSASRTPAPSPKKSLAQSQPVPVPALLVDRPARVSAPASGASSAASQSPQRFYGSHSPFLFAPSMPATPSSAASSPAKLSEVSSQSIEKILADIENLQQQLLKTQSVISVR